jgi:hypothetical protein
MQPQTPQEGFSLCLLWLPPRFPASVKLFMRDPSAVFAARFASVQAAHFHADSMHIVLIEFSAMACPRIRRSALATGHCPC